MRPYLLTPRADDMGSAHHSSSVKIFQAVEFALQGALRCGCDLPENVIGRTDRTKPLAGVIGGAT
jgi:hypothetical protein